MFQSSDGTLINAMWWLGFGGGRLFGVVLFKYFTPRTIILVDLVGITASMTAVCIWGEQSAAVAWSMTVIYAFFQATVYPGGVTWANQYVNMTGRYIFLFTLGQAIGSMSLVPVAGIVFDNGPFNVMYMILGESVGNAVTFGLLMLEANRIKHKVNCWESNKDKDLNATAYDHDGVAL